MLKAFFHIILKSFVTRKEMEQLFLGWNWVIVNDDGAYKRMIKCTKVVELRNVKEYLYEAG
jgi:hypothetical protein